MTSAHEWDLQNITCQKDLMYVDRNHSESVNFYYTEVSITPEARSPVKQKVRENKGLWVNSFWGRKIEQEPEIRHP